MSLTKRKRAFIEIYCSRPDFNPTEAARQAGFGYARAKQTAYELLHRDADVMREVERRLANKCDLKVEGIAKAAKSGEVSRESLCQQCDELIEECRLAGAGSWQMQTRLKAIEMKAKLYGLLSEKVELGLDDKLVELLESGRKRSGITPAQPAPVIKGELIAGLN